MPFFTLFYVVSLNNRYFFHFSQRVNNLYKCLIHPKIGLFDLFRDKNLHHE